MANNTEGELQLRLVMNNWLSGQFARVAVLSQRDHIVTLPNGKQVVYNETCVRFPHSDDFNNDVIWVPTETLDSAPEPGFQEWTGVGIWAT